MEREFKSQVCPQCSAPIQALGQRATCEYCGAALVRSQAPDGDGHPTWGLHFRMISCVDQQGTQMPAFRLLIPKTWEFEGGVRWPMSNPGMPAVIAFRAFNPQGAEAFEVFPNIPCYWSNNPMVMAFFPPGASYFGSEVRPPAPAVEVLRALVLPRYRAGTGELEILSQEPLPDLPEQVRSSGPVAPDGLTTADGGRIRVRYRLGDQEIEEEFYGVVEEARLQMPAMMGMMEIVNWSASYLFSFRAQAGHLDRLADLFLSIVRSFRLDPQWFNRFTQISQGLIQNQNRQIQQAGQVSQIISRTNDEISDMIRSSYEARQATMDGLSSQFSQAMRGVDQYHDSYKGYDVELPGGYDHAWSTALGEYILTNDPNFNPNIGSNLNWAPLDRS
jgi:hypothetical protein